VVQRNGQTVANYTYNAMGQRVAKVATANQRFAYDEGSQLIGEYGTTSRSYVWLDSLPVAMVDTTGTTSTVSYVHADDLGTPRAVTDGTGSTVWEWRYQSNPFGELVASGALTFNPRFPGQYYDGESNLSHNINRDYEAATDRYVQSDPVGLDGGLSTYAYVGSNPFLATDPLGTQGVPILIPVPVQRTQSWPLIPDLPKPTNNITNKYDPLVTACALNGPACLPNTIEAMTARGNVADTQIVGDYGREYSESKARGCPPPDRCKWLEENAGQYRPDQVKKTQKAWGCRGSRSGKGGKSK